MSRPTWLTQSDLGEETRAGRGQVMPDLVHSGEVLGFYPTAIGTLEICGRGWDLTWVLTAQRGYCREDRLLGARTGAEVLGTKVEVTTGSGQQ